MDYICENTQHFGWGTSCRLRDPDGNITFMDVMAKQIAEGFELPKEGETYTMDGPPEEPMDDPPSEGPPSSER